MAAKTKTGGIPGKGSIDSGDAPQRIKQALGGSSAFAASDSSMFTISMSGGAAQTNSFSIGVDGAATPRLQVLEAPAASAAFPFQIRSVGPGKSGIYLPYGCVEYDGDVIPGSRVYKGANEKEPIAALDDAGIGPWYELPFDPPYGFVYLSIVQGDEGDEDESDGQLKAVLTQHVPAEGALAYAQLYGTDATGRMYATTVSAVRFAVSMASSFDPFRWDPATKSVGYGTVTVGRRGVRVNGAGVIRGESVENRKDGTYSIHVTVPATGTPTAEVVEEDATEKEPTGTECWVPLYKIEEGRVTEDQRGSFFVMCWE